MPPRILYSCACCRKKFVVEKTRDQHRSNATACRIAYNQYLQSLNPPPNPVIAESVAIDVDEQMDAPESPPYNDATTHDVDYDVVMEEPLTDNQDGLLQPPYVATEEAVSTVDSASNNSESTDSEGGYASSHDVLPVELDVEWEGFHAAMAEPISEPENYIKVFPDAGRIINRGVMCPFDHILSKHKALGLGLYHPFADREEYELVQWLHVTGASSTGIDDFVKLRYVQSRPLSFGSAKKMRSLIEQLPDATPRWMEHKITPAHGTPDEPVLMLYRDPLKLISYLLSRPTFADCMEYAPQQVWNDEEMDSRRYSEMSTGDWWWRTQESLPEGSTVIPVMLGSDKTQLTVLAGDKVAWPVYLSIGNISSKVRNTPSRKAWLLFAYLPAINFVEGANHSQRNSTLIYRLFHQCMEFLLRPLVMAGRNGILWSDSKGDERRCFPLLAAYIADHPEQTLINIALQNASSTTTARSEDIGNPVPSPPRTREWILDQIKEACAECDPGRFDAYYEAARVRGINTVNKPFWRHHLKYQPEICIAPDLLHGPGKFWRDHLLKWVRRLVGFNEYDVRLKALQPVRGYRHFKKGISHISQWTGREDRELQRTTVALIAGAPNVTDEVMRNVRAYHDFLYFAQYRSHSDSTLRYLTQALNTFHATKNVYIDLGVRFGGVRERKARKQGMIDNFNIPKLAAFHSYPIHIKEMGSSPQYSSDITEYLHKLMAKIAFDKTNRKEFGGQMARFIDRTDRLHQVPEFVEWCIERTKQAHLEQVLRAHRSTSPGYQALLEQSLQPGWIKDNIPAKTRDKTARLWVTIVPHLRQQEIYKIATNYNLPKLGSAIRAFLFEGSRASSGQAPISLPRILWIDVWHNMRIRTPDVQDDSVCSISHTIEAMPPSREMPYGHCHFVLVHDGDEVDRVGIKGYRVAQIRLFFRLHLEDCKHGAHLKPFAYIQELSEPTPGTEDDIRMYLVSRTERAGEHRKGRVISIESIWRFVQLVPHFGPQADPQLNAYNSAEICRDFWVNQFGDKQMFQSTY